MALKDALIAELKHESSMTKKMLEKVPMDKRNWKPHERSMTLGHLATHVADTTHWASTIIHIDNFDFAALAGRAIAVDDHCYGCTAGQGSS